MKRVIVLLLLIITSYRTVAQADELKQLALNIEKLAQFKQILADLKKSYQVLYGGYTTIKTISEGNFKLHELFLDGLLEASPAVKKYKKIADIIRLQLQLVKEYKSSFTYFKNCGHFTIGELDYMGKVYGRLFSQSLAHLDDLFNVLTSKSLRMSDAERLNMIDRLHAGMVEKMHFLRQFNSSNSVLGIQRVHEKNDVDVMRKLHDIK